MSFTVRRAKAKQLQEMQIRQDRERRQRNLGIIERKRDYRIGKVFRTRVWVGGRRRRKRRGEEEGAFCLQRRDPRSGNKIAR